MYRVPIPQAESALHKTGVGVGVGVRVGVGVGVGGVPPIVQVPTAQFWERSNIALQLEIAPWLAQVPLVITSVWSAAVQGGLIGAQT